MRLFVETMTVIRFWNNSATSCAAALRLTTPRFNWRKSVSVIRRIIPAMNVRPLKGHMDETFLHTGHHRSDWTTGFCGRFLSQVLHREDAHTPVDAGVRCHGFCEDDGNPRQAVLAPFPPGPLNRLH